MDLEEIKKSQTVMVSAITEINNTLEGTNSRITETEKELIRWRWKWGNKWNTVGCAKKKKKENRKSSENSGTILNALPWES